MNYLKGTWIHSIEHFFYRFYVLFLLILFLHLKKRRPPPPTFSDVSPRVLDGGVSVDVGELSEAEPVVIVHARVGEAVHEDVTVAGVVHFSDAEVKLVVGDGAPTARLLELYGGRLGSCDRTRIGQLLLLLLLLLLLSVAVTRVHAFTAGFVALLLDEGKASGLAVLKKKKRLKFCQA